MLEKRTQYGVTLLGDNAVTHAIPYVEGVTDALSLGTELAQWVINQLAGESAIEKERVSLFLTNDQGENHDISRPASGGKDPDSLVSKGFFDEFNEDGEYLAPRERN